MNNQWHVSWFQVARSFLKTRLSVMFFGGTRGGRPQGISERADKESCPSSHFFNSGQPCSTLQFSHSIPSFCPILSIPTFLYNHTFSSCESIIGLLKRIHITWPSCDCTQGVDQPDVLASQGTLFTILPLKTHH